MAKEDEADSSSSCRNQVYGEYRNESQDKILASLLPPSEGTHSTSLGMAGVAPAHIADSRIVQKGETVQDTPSYYSGTLSSSPAGRKYLDNCQNIECPATTEVSSDHITKNSLHHCMPQDANSTHAKSFSGRVSDKNECLHQNLNLTITAPVLSHLNSCRTFVKDPRQSLTVSDGSSSNTVHADVAVRSCNSKDETVGTFSENDSFSRTNFVKVTAATVLLEVSTVCQSNADLPEQRLGEERLCTTDVSAGSRPDQCALAGAYSDSQTSGKSVLSKIAGRHPLLSPCSCKKFHCREKIPEVKRREIHCQFWSLENSSARQQWIMKHMVFYEPKQFVNRKTCWKWYLPDSSGNTIQVCRTFFLKTLGYRWDHILQYTMGKKQPAIGILSPSQQTENRQKEDNLCDLNMRFMVSHIQLFLRKYYPYKKRAYCLGKHRFQYGLVKRAFIELKIFHPSLRVSYKDFWRIFQKFRSENPSSYTEFSSKRCPTFANVMSDKKVVMHLDIENDAVIILKNLSDSDTETEGEKVTCDTDQKVISPDFAFSTESTPYLLKQNHHTRMAEYPLQPSCHCKCRCSEQLSETRRRAIYDSFWSLQDSAQQKQWFFQHTQQTSRQPGTGRRRETRTYFLTNENGFIVAVCSRFFHTTLGFPELGLLETFCDILPVGKKLVQTDQSGRRGLSPYVRAHVEDHITAYLKNLENMKELVLSPKKAKSLKLLHADFTCTQPHCSISYAQYISVYHDLCRAFSDKFRNEELKQMQMSDLEEGKLEAAGDVKDSLPRRRSTRKTRMQGSMTEDNLLELGGESGMVSSIVSFHEITSHRRDGLSDNDKCCCQNGSGEIRPRGRKRGCKPGLKNKRKECKITSGKRQYQKKKSDYVPESEGEVVSPSGDNDSTDYTKNAKARFKLKALKKKHRHPMLPPCNCSRRKCIEKIPEGRRQEIHTVFWEMESYKNRKKWLAKYVERRERRMKSLTLFPQRKNESKKYYLPDRDGKAVEVCRLFFIHTMGFKWHSVVDIIAKAKKPKKCLRRAYILKRPRRELPEYIVNSVKQYIEGLRELAQNIDKGSDNESSLQTGVVLKIPEASKIFDPSKLKEEELLQSAQQKTKYSESEIRSPDKMQCQRRQEVPHLDPSKLKVKDLFKDYRMKYKSLKFNLGYQSFRRIFQSVVDPGEGDNKKDMDSDLSDLDSDPGEDSEGRSCQTLTKRAALLDKIVQKKKGKKLKCREYKHEDFVSGSTEEQSLDRSDSEPQECTTSTDSQLGETSKETKDSDDCILDVGSGYLTSASRGAAILETKYPYTYESKYKRRRALSMRNNRINYPVLPPCKCSKRKCPEKFTEAQRQKINDRFWSLGSYNQRKQWILEHIKRENIKRRVVAHGGTPRKLESRWYYLPDEEGKKLDVCKDFFLRTLGYKWDSVIDTIGKTTPKGEKWAAPDKRGKKPPPHKISEEAISSMTLYVESVCHTYRPLYQKKCQSQKKGSKSSTGNLVTYGLTMKQLFEDYKSKHPNHKFGYESFRKVFHRVHTAIMASLPPLPEASEDPEQDQSDEGVSADQDFSESTNANCVPDFPAQNTHLISSSESYPSNSHYTSPPLPAPLLHPIPGQVTQAHQPTALPQPHQLTNTVPERRSCLYQYGNQPHLSSMPGTESASAGQECFNTMDHDSFMKYSHNLYGPQPVIGTTSGHFPQIGDPLGYNGNHNSRTEMIDPTAAGGQNQFPTYFMSNPEPLRRQVYQMASQYQSILHHIAESSRLLNYGSFPPADSTFQNTQDKQYPYSNRQDLYRENSYPMARAPHSYMAECNPYPAHNSSMAQEPMPMVISPYSQHNDKNFMANHDESLCMIQTADGAAGSFAATAPDMGKDKRSSKKGQSAGKKSNSDQPKVKKERKIKPKSARNYGDHYPMLSPCHCKKRKCLEKFPQCSRQRIHDMYWDLKNYNERKQWMLLHIKREDCKRRRVDQHESSRKQESRWYYFPDEDGHLQEVCKDFFLRTLGYKWDSVIDTIRRTTPKGETSTRPDMRGRKPPAHKLSLAIIRSVVQYIQSMHQASQPASDQCHPDLDTLESHSSDSCSGRVSIPYGLTMKDLYDDYKVKHAGHKIGYESFRRIFRDLSRSDGIIIDEKSSDQDLLNPENNDSMVDF